MNDKIASNKNKNYGVVITTKNTPNVREFYFQFQPESNFRENSFVIVENKYGKILGRITELFSTNPIYSDYTFIDESMSYGLNLNELYKMKPLLFAKVQTLKLITNNIDSIPDIPVFPGDNVYIATAELISKFLRLEDGIHLGSLYGRSDIKIHLNLEKFLTQHIAVLGATGSGKSWTNAVIIEEIIKQKIPVLIVDPHGEYETMSKLAENAININFIAPNGSSILNKKFSNPLIKKYPFFFDPFTTNFRFFSELIDATDPQKDLIYLVFAKKGEFKKTQKPLFNDKSEENLNSKFKNLLERLETIGYDYEFDNKTIKTVKRKMRMIIERNFIGDDLPYLEFLKKNTITILDVSETEDDKTMRAIVAIILDKILSIKKLKGLKTPILILIEESHNFCPQNSNPPSKIVIRRVGREGRKFGMFLILTSQRIVGLDKDVLSQCNTKLTLKIDSLTDIHYIKPYLSFLSENDFNKLSYLPTGVAFISGYSVSNPILVKIKNRITPHGGATPSLH
ncbi:MAG: ATP-binding protein [Candidatus Helarchaeota archaeon]